MFAYYTKEEQIQKLLEKNLTLEEIYAPKTLLLAQYASIHTPALYASLLLHIKTTKGVNLNDFKRQMKFATAKQSAAVNAEDDFASVSTPLVLDGIDTMNLSAPGGWEVDEYGVKKEEFKDGIPYVRPAFSAPVFVSRQLASIDSDEMKLELTFRCNYCWKKVIVPRGDVMDKSKLVKYANLGLPVTSETARESVNYLEAFETLNRNAIPQHRSIERMGWIGHKEFFPYHMENAAVYDGAGEESHRIIAAVAPHGDKDKWMEMAAKLRTMQAARVMLAASFASVLLQPLQLRPFIFHLWANSRSGKTAVLKAAVSIYGDPNVLLRSYNSTAVGIERTASTVRNIPLALDELQSLSMKYEYLARITYMLGNGIGKMRGDRSGGTQQLQTWCNTILSTGEQPITLESSMDGENTRVMELYASPIDDTDFARKVHQISAENYGFAGQMFMDYLFREYELEKDISKLRKAYTECRDTFSSSYETAYGKCTSIYQEYAAVLVFADYIASVSVFGEKDVAAKESSIQMGCDLLEIIKKDAKDDAVDRAWDAVSEWVVSNKNHFEVKRKSMLGDQVIGYEPLYGRYEPAEGKLYILPTCLNRMLTDAGFSYTKSIRGFKERSYIAEKQQQHRVGTDSVKTIAAHMTLDYDEDE